MAEMSEGRWAPGTLIPEYRPEEEKAKESADCPYCGQTFYALPLHDPLKHHVDYCEARPVDDEPDDTCRCGHPDCGSC